MTISPEGLALEDHNIGPNGKPTLGAAFKVFRGQRESGERDRERSADVRPAQAPGAHLGGSANWRLRYFTISTCYHGD